MRQPTPAPPPNRCVAWPASRGTASRLILLLALVLSPACSSDPAPSRMDLAVDTGEVARATVRERVADPDRRDEALALVDEITAVESGYVKRERAIRVQLFELNANFDADPDDFRLLYDDLEIARDQALDELLANLNTLEVVLTREEWLALTDSLEATQGAWSTAQ